MRVQCFLPKLALAFAAFGFVAPVLAADDALTGKINNGAAEVQSPPPRANNGPGADSLGQTTEGKGPVIEPADPGPPGPWGLSREAAEAAATPPGGPPGASPQTMPSTLSARNAAADKLSWIERELTLASDQKRTIAQGLAAAGGKSESGGSTTGSDASRSTIWVGNVLPLSVNLRDFPASLTAQIPELAGLQYVKLADRILIVEPSERVVLAEVSL
jgi:hypothetical protein